MESGRMESMTKKEALTLQRELTKLERSLGGIKDMGGLPDAIFVIDVGYEKIALLEAKKLGIPVIAVVDTNRSPDNVDYLIPGNDDSRSAIELYTSAAADAIIHARNANLTGAAEDFVEVEEVEEVAAVESTEIPAQVAEDEAAKTEESSIAASDASK